MNEQLCLFSQEEMDNLIDRHVIPHGTILVRCIEDGEKVYNTKGEWVGTWHLHRVKNYKEIK